MKKGLVIGACFLFILIVLMSFATAGFFSDFWGKITGKISENPQQTCQHCLLNPLYHWCKTDNTCRSSSDTPCSSSDRINDRISCPSSPSCPTSCPASYECGDYTPDDATCGVVPCGVCTLGGETCDTTTHLCSSAAEEHSTNYEGVLFGEYNSFDDGGDSSFSKAECCGDDSDEFLIHKVVDFSQTTDTIKTDTSDFACCNKPTDCVADSFCYSSNGYYESALTSCSPNKPCGEYCLNGVWYDEVFDMRSATLGFPDLWTVERGKLIRVDYGEFRAKGYTILKSKAIFPIGEGFNYVLEGTFKSSSSEKLYFGFVPLDENMSQIKVTEINVAFDNSVVQMASLNLVASKTSNSIALVKTGLGCNWDIDKNSYIAFDAKDDFSDLPNRNVYKIKSFDKSNCKLTLSSSLKKNYAKNTLVRHHKDSSSYMYSAAPGNSITTGFVTYYSQPLKVEGVKGVDLYNEFWPGTRYVQVLILANFGDTGTKTTTFKDLSLTRTGDTNGLKFNFPNPSVKRIYGIAELVSQDIKRTGYAPASPNPSVINWGEMVDEDDSANCFFQSCVFNDVCYPRANFPHVNSPSMSVLKGVGFNPGDDDNIAFCYTNEWLDCDVGASWCEDACGLRWANSGESRSFGEYGSINDGGNTLTGEECCGDDADEFYIYQVVDSSAIAKPFVKTNKGIFACCNKPTDCVAEGKCFDSDQSHSNVFTTTAGAGGTPIIIDRGDGIIRAQVTGGSLGTYCLNGVWYDESSDVPAKYVSTSSEYKRGVQVPAWKINWGDDSNDKKTCNDLSCVFDNICYPPTDGLLSISRGIGFNFNGVDNIAFCYTDDWEDCDGSQGRCENSCGLDWAYPGEFTKIVDPYCGDGDCNGVETFSNCPVDCKEVVGSQDPVTCDDSDANDDYPYGKNYEEFGMYPPKFKDRCGGILVAGGSKNELKEYYCGDSGEKTYEWHDCELDSMVCEEGVCVVSCGDDSDCMISPKLKCNTSTSECVECLDGGDCSSGEDCIGGACVAEAQCTPDSVSKTCKNIRCGTVENNCEDDVVCDDECLTGVCLPQKGCLTCHDPDEGKDDSYMTKKTTRGRGMDDKTDECTENGLREYICDNDVLSFVDYDCDCDSGECSSGWVCDSNGACIDTGDCFEVGGKMRRNYGIDDIDAASSTANKEKIKKILKKINVECGASINEIKILNKSLYNPPKNTRIIEVLSITTDITTNANVSFTLNKSEIGSANDVGFYVLEDGTWNILNATLETIVAEDSDYDYTVEIQHFSIFLITEPYYCGNGDFDFGEELCDNSVEGVTHCVSDCTACEDDFEVNESGFCLEFEENIECSDEGDTKCRGYSFYECDNNLEWDRQGIVIGECGVECYPIGNSSCQGDFSLLCRFNYNWIIQGNIDGLCGYVSLTGGTVLGDTYSDEDESSEEGEDIKKKSQSWIILLIVGIFVLAVLVIFVLFKIFNKERDRSGLTTSKNYPTRPRSKGSLVQGVI